MLLFRFADYGVMLEINDLQYLPDGRSFLDCVGGRRFKVNYKIKIISLIKQLDCMRFQYFTFKILFARLSKKRPVKRPKAN